MKHFLLVLVSLLITSQNFAQEKPSNYFDFWIGSWDVTWTYADGSPGKGTNEITKVLDGSVIQENFVGLEGAYKGFKGISISVYNQAQDKWYQTWQDNQGGNINLTGELDGDKRIFRTALDEANGQRIYSRMVFYDIKKDSFTWDWEQTTDGGETWTLNWRINYKRRS